MADIELVIKISEELLRYFNSFYLMGVNENKNVDKLVKVIKHGIPLPKGHGALKDADKIEDITWQEPYYHDALNVLSEIRDKIRNQRTIIKADKENNE